MAIVDAVAKTDSGTRVRICMMLHKSVLHDSRVRREAATLHEQGHDVTVLELTRDVSRPLSGLRRISAHPRRRLPTALGGLLFRLMFTKNFVMLGVRTRPDVIHAHDAAMLVPGLLAARISGAKLVYDSHELATGVPYREAGWARFVATIERLAIRRCAAVITVSEGIAEQLRRRYGLSRPPVVLRNACSLPNGRAPVGLRALLRLRDEPLVLHQGAAAQDRGCDVLLRAVADLPGVHLCFLGDGDSAAVARLRMEAAVYGVDDRVHFVGSVPLERLLAHTAEADVGVSLLQDTCENHRLALPNKLFEYVAAGVPVLVSDLPEMGRLVREQAIGWTVDPADHVAVTAALERALDESRDPALRDRVATAADAFSWGLEKDALVTLYDELSRR